MLVTYFHVFIQQVKSEHKYINITLLYYKFIYMRIILKFKLFEIYYYSILTNIHALL